MAATVAPPPTRLIPRVGDVHAPRWFERLPNWVIAGGTLIVLLGISGYLRSYWIGGQFWMDEAITTGIASHPLGEIPGLLRHDGSPPLFYFLLHFWIQAFGSSEAATHALNLVFGLLTIPAGMWAGWSLFGRRAGLMAAVLFAFSPWLTAYAQETRMYELMGLLAILATAAFIHAFVFRRRGYLVLFAISLALMLYTHAWGMFFAAGAILALIPVWLNTPKADGRGLVKDALMAFVGAGILFLPWLPNFIYQASHTGAPWAPPPRFGAPVLLSRDLVGGDRIMVTLLVALIIGLAPLFTKAYRRGRAASAMWALIVLPIATLLLAWLSSQITPAFVSRYFAPVLASILLLGAWGASRSGIVGIVAIILSAVFVVHVSSYAPEYKSDMRDISGEVTPYLHPGDLVILGQPEQVPLAWYYLPNGLRYANVLGPQSDPRHFDWVYALKRLRAAKAQPTLAPLLTGLHPGQQVLFVRPLTEGVGNWKADWTLLVRRRSAQWGALLAADPRLRRVAVAPHNYRGVCCVGDSAILYRFQ